MTIQNYYYSSSAELLTLNTGNDLSPVTGDTGRLFYANGNPIDGGNISAPIAGIVVSVPIGNANIGGATAIFTSDGTSITEAYINFGGYTGQFDPSTAGNNPGGFPTADYEVGDIFNIPSSALSSLGVSQTITFKIQIRNMRSKISTTSTSTSVSDTGSENNFSLCTTNPYSCTSTNPTYTQQCFPAGHFAVKYPTFLVTDRDPFEVLNGLNNGSVTRFTIRRQVEDETSVMAYNITAPSGSEGVNTLTGGGFLIPDDMSQTQKDNALNIINNLRAKRAFTGKQESGV
jgi:hypothetical protein